MLFAPGACGLVGLCFVLGLILVVFCLSILLFDSLWLLVLRSEVVTFFMVWGFEFRFG